MESGDLNVGERFGVLRFLLLLLWLPSNLGAGDFVAVRDWGSAHGTDLGMVEAAAQTADGYLWFGSASGLYRLNGHEFRGIDPRPGNPEESLHVTALLAARDGSLWVGTFAEGLYHIEKGSSSIYRVDKGLTNDRIKCLFQDSAGAVWVGTDGGGAFRLVEDRFEPLKLPDLPAPTHPTAFAEDAKGQFWIGTPGAGFYQMHQGRVVSHLRPAPNVKAIQPGPDGRLWLITTGGLAWMDGDRPRRVPLLQADGSTTNKVFLTSFAQDRWGDFWLGTLQGLIRYAPGGQEFLGRDRGLGNGLVTSVFADREGSVWVGTEVGDLHQLRRQKIRMMAPFEPGLQGVNALHTDPQGRLWIGGSQGLVGWKDGRRIWSPPKDSPAAREVCAIGSDAEGRLWFALRFGDWGYLEEDRMVRIPTDQLTTGQRSPSFFLQTRHHGFLVGTPGHFIRITNQQSLVSLGDLGLSHADVKCAYEAPDGSLWIGTSYGLNRLKDGKVEIFIDLKPRPIEIVTSICGDSDGTVWICSYRGIWRYRDGAFFAFGPDHGLPSRTASLVDDGRGALWIQSGTLVYPVAKKELHAVADGLQERLAFRSWGRSDGLTAAIRAGGQHGAVLPDGQVCFGTDAGVAFVQAQDPPGNDLPPSPKIEYLVVNGEVQDWSQRRRRDAGRVVLPPGYNRLEIHFAGLSYRAPSQVSYAHRMLGLNPDWEPTLGQRVASFRALPPGKYVFQLAATNEAGVASIEPASLEVVALAPWWNTPPARVLLAAVALAVMSLVYGFRIRHLKQLGDTRREYSRRLLDHQESERSRLARELHDGLGQDLLIIKNQTAMLELELPQDPDLVRSRLRDIATTSQSAIDQARDIAHNLRPAELDRVGLGSSIEAMVERAAGSSSIHFDARVAPIDGRLEKAAEVLLYRISQELVNNILKHSGANHAKLELVHLPDEAAIELRVEDDGRGFDMDSTANRRGRAGGLGLPSVRERVEMLHGSAKVESAVGEGTKWFIRIPCGRRSA